MQPQISINDCHAINGAMNDFEAGGAKGLTIAGEEFIWEKLGGLHLHFKKVCSAQPFVMRSYLQS
jgi:hypothetical protein